MGNLRALLVGLMVAGGAGACSGSLNHTEADAGRDGAARDSQAPVDHAVDRAVDRVLVDRSLDATGDATGGAGGRDAGADRPDGSAVCAPLATQCSGGDLSECQPTWTEALAHPQCVGTRASAPPLSVETRIDCGAYHIRYIGHIDSGETYYYDIVTGRLVALIGSNGACYGPPQGITVSCPENSTATPVCTLYGGALSLGDGGVPGDGGESTCLPAAFETTAVRLNWNAPCKRDGGTDAGPVCYASCDIYMGSYKYVGCVAGSSIGSTCYASCSECP